jgi:hypothetical protein
MKTDFKTLYRNSEGEPYLSVRIYDCGDLDFYGKTFEEFYDLKEEDNIGSDFGRFGYHLFYRLGCCIHNGSFSIRKPNTKAKLQKMYTYNLIEPKESIENPIQLLTEDQLSGYVVHQTVSKDVPHLRHFTVYGVDEKEIAEITSNYDWFTDILEEEIFGSSDLHYHWLTDGGKDPIERRKFADQFIERYHRTLKGEKIAYPIVFDVLGVPLNEESLFLSELENDVPF